MAESQYDPFLQEATPGEPETDFALGRKRLYGLYISPCLLAQAAPRSEEAFWVAMKKKRSSPGRTGLHMRGLAAADYILASNPGQV